MDSSLDLSDVNRLLEFLGALANPQRLRVVAALVQGRAHVSGLARDVGMSRPLLYLHLQKLEAAGIIRGSLELSSDGKAMKYFELLPFDVHVTSDLVALAAQTLSTATSEKED